MIERRRNPTPADQIERGNEIIAKYNRRLLWLAGVTAAVLIGLLMFALVKIGQIADDAKMSADNAATQTKAIAGLLKQEAEEDAGRQHLIDTAVAQIAAEQYRALVAHDRRTEELLRRNLRLLDREVNAPANQERQPVPMIPIPAPAPRPVLVGPPTGVAPVPAPKPAPEPVPCKGRGKSGKCKR